MLKLIFVIFAHVLIASCEENNESNANFLEVIAFRKLGSYSKQQGVHTQEISGNARNFMYFRKFPECVRLGKKNFQIGGFTDDGIEYHKTYYLSRNTWATWIESHSFCKLYGLEFLTLETAAEAQEYLNMVETNTFLRSQANAWFYVDAFAMTPGSCTDWYWSTTGKKVSFPIRWRPGSPNSYPCLVLNKPSLNERFYFYDDSCTWTAGAACQKTNILTPQSEK